MNKFILGAVLAASILVVSPAMADHDDYRHHGEYGHRGGGDGWNWLGGAIIGGMIVDQIDRNRYAPPPAYVQYPPPYAAPPPMRRVMRCANFIVTDQWGNEFIQQRCYYELVPLQ